MVSVLVRRSRRERPWPDAAVNYSGWTVRWLLDTGPVPAGTEGRVGGHRKHWRGRSWQITFHAGTENEVDVFRRLPRPEVELVAPPASRSYYAAFRAVRSTWGLWRHREPVRSDGRDYTGCTAKAVTGRDVPPGTESPVVAAQRQGDDLVHVIDFRPLMGLHVPLPWPGIELIEPPG